MTRKLKLITAVLLLSTVAAVISGCSSKPYNYTLSDYATVGAYTGIEVSASEIEAQVDSSIQSFITQNTTQQDVTDRAVQDGDIVNIDYAGTHNGEAFAGGTAAGTDLTIGSNQFIDGFEEGLIGANIGDKLTLNLKFPDDYTNDPTLAGEQVEFAVTVNSIKVSVTPELTDELVHTKYSYLNTVDEYKTQLRKSAKENLVWNKVVEASTIIKYPEKEIKKYYDQMLNVYKYYATNLYGTTLEAYVTSTAGTDMETFLAQLVTSSKSQIKSDLIFYTIARNENISFTDAEYDTYASRNALTSGYEDLKAYEEATGKDKVEESVLWNKVLEFVAASAVEVE